MAAATSRAGSGIAAAFDGEDEVTGPTPTARAPPQCRRSQAAPPEKIEDRDRRNRRYGVHLARRHPCRGSHLDQFQFWTPNRPAGDGG